LVFTGGVGERSPAIRAHGCRGLDFLGVELDPDRNREARGDAQIGVASAPIAVAVVEAREDVQIVAEAREVLGRDGA
jgi:acetate kinase